MMRVTKNICRLCLSQYANFDIFKENPKIFDTIRLITNLKIIPGDGLPKNICKMCIDLIRTIISFREKCENNDRLLRMELNLDATVKKEIDNEICCGARNIVDEDFDNNTKIQLTECKVKIESLDESISTDPLNVKTNLFNTVKKTDLKSPKSKKNETVEKKGQSDLTKLLNKKLSKYKGRKKRNKKPSIYIKTDNVCLYCGLIFNTISKWQEHLRTHNPKPFECDTCGAAFNSRTKIAVHIQTHKNKDCQCDACGKMYKTPYDVHRHKIQVHNWVLADCKICGKPTKDSGLKAHMKTHSSGTRVYECDYCRRKFGYKHTLVIHIRTHTGEKPLKCRFCSAKFANARNMANHERLHTGERPYGCSECGMEFVQLSNMKSHFRNNHKGIEFRYQKKRSSLNSI